MTNLNAAARAYALSLDAQCPPSPTESFEAGWEAAQAAHEPCELRPPVKLEDYGPVIDEVAPVPKEAWDAMKSQGASRDASPAGPFIDNFEPAKSVAGANFTTLPGWKLGGEWPSTSYSNSKVSIQPDFREPPVGIVSDGEVVLVPEWVWSRCKAGDTVGYEWKKNQHTGKWFINNVEVTESSVKSEAAPPADEVAPVSKETWDALKSDELVSFQPADEFDHVTWYGCVGPEGDYDAGMEAGDGDYVHRDDWEKLLAAYRSAQRTGE